MATPPTFVSYVASVFNTVTTPKTVSVSVQAGDLLVVASVAESGSGGATNTAPTGGSETYAQVATLGADINTARAIAWEVTAASTQSYSISCVRPLVDTSKVWGCMAWILRGSDGFGAVGAPAVGSTSNSVTLTTLGDNSGLVVFSADWNAADGTTRTRRTVNGSTGAEDIYFRGSTTYTVYGQRYTDCGAAGSVTAGYSAPTGQASAIIAVEVKGSAGAAPLPPELVMQSRRAY